MFQRINGGGLSGYPIESLQFGQKHSLAEDQIVAILAMIFSQRMEFLRMPILSHRHSLNTGSTQLKPVDLLLTDMIHTTLIQITAIRSGTSFHLTVWDLVRLVWIFRNKYTLVMAFQKYSSKKHFH